MQLKACLVVTSACQAGLVQAHVQRVAAQPLIVCPDIDHDGQHPGGVEAGCCDVQVQLACKEARCEMQ